MTSRRADVGAVEVEPDALTQFKHHLLAQTGVGTHGAGLRAIEALFDAADERLVG